MGVCSVNVHEADGSATQQGNSVQTNDDLWNQVGSLGDSTRYWLVCLQQMITCHLTLTSSSGRIRGATFFDLTWLALQFCHQGMYNNLLVTSSAPGSVACIGSGCNTRRDR